MAITSASEFEAVLSRIHIRISKRIDQLRDAQKLRDARRRLAEIEELARDNVRLKAKREELSEAAKVVRTEMPKDAEMSHLLWDLMDFIDYRC